MSDTAISKIKRRYFEAFGDLEEENRFLKKLNFVKDGTIVLLIVFVFLLAKRVPVVIRVSDVAGAEAIRDLRENNAPTAYEMIGFAKRFVTNYTGYNSYTVKRDMAKALNQMSGRFQKEAKKKLIDSGFLEKVKDAGIDTQIEFKESRVERNSQDAAVISLVGVRRVSKYGADRSEETLFRTDLVLKKIPRTENVAEGMLVDQYGEILLNDLTERK